MKQTFSVQISNWTDKAKRNMERVVKASIQDVMEVAQTPVSKGGRMRVDTGFLRNSLTSYLNGSTVMSGVNSYVLAVGQMDMGDVFFSGWTASYALPREFGPRGQSPDFFMRGAAAQWKQIVAANVARVS